MSPWKISCSGSRYWRQGIGSTAVAAMLDELRARHGVNLYVAVLKSANHRSLALLKKLGFENAGEEQVVAFGASADEQVMVRPAGCAAPCGSSR